MPLTQSTESSSSSVAGDKLPVSVLIPVRNEGKNLPRCLESLRDVGQVFVIDSQSVDDTEAIALQYGAQVVQFHYRGDGPRSGNGRWKLFRSPSTGFFFLDADEVLTAELKTEMRQAIQNPHVNGYSIALRMWFLGRALRHGDASFWKLSLFRRGMGRYECRLKDQDASMADMEVHEHVVVDGLTEQLRNPIIHHNVESLSRYIEKHDEYSNWEARVLMAGNDATGEVKPRHFSVPRPSGGAGSRCNFLTFRALPYCFSFILSGRLGFLDGVPGLIYCGFQAVQLFHTKAKIYELRSRKV